MVFVSCVGSPLIDREKEMSTKNDSCDCLSLQNIMTCTMWMEVWCVGNVGRDIDDNFQPGSINAITLECVQCDNTSQPVCLPICHQPSVSDGG